MSIDPIEYGRLLESVETLTVSVNKLSGEVQVITERLNTGKGVIFGLMIAAGGLGAGVSETIKHLFSK